MDESNFKHDTNDVGPKAEIEYWRTRMQKITGWCELLKSKDFTLVKNTLFKHK